MRHTVFAPGSIGNVGPGFDVLGLAVGGELGDRVTVELTEGDAQIVEITGVDADLLPRDPLRNAASIAATAWLRAHGDSRNALTSIHKGLPLSGGLGGSAASSVAGAYAAALAMGMTPAAPELIAAAFAGERAVAGRHLDNIAPCVLGGLALVRCLDPVDALRLPVAAEWSLVLVTPEARIDTKAARRALADLCERGQWVQQMANTAGVMHAFATADGELLRRSFEDLYAEPRRSPLIPHFDEVKQAARDAGAFCCGISGSGPTLVAVVDGESRGRQVAMAMRQAFAEVGSAAHVVPIAREGAHPI
jgi:homoserine kinase